jgi:fatty-acyl-CoA synthase
MWDRLPSLAVVPVPHPRLGEAVVLCAVQGEHPVTAEEVVAHLKGVLASYKVPKRVVFVTMDELPHTASEKVRESDAQRLAARSVVAAGDDPEWAEFLQREHPDLLANG